MIPRSGFRLSVEKALGRSSICALLGPRQCGKTSLARMIGEASPSDYFDLESPRDQLRLQNPEMTLGALSGLVILDEIQTRVDLFPILRVLADRPGHSARFLILGSASPELRGHSAETLAGRVEFIDMQGFDMQEVGVESWKKLWLQGGFPRSFLAKTVADSFVWREGFIRTFLERDIPQAGIRIPEPAMRRFWTMLAHAHGQLWNASELGRSMGLTDKTVRGYLDILTQTYMVRQLQPWFENLGKRQVKSPKIYLRDTGLLHNLLTLSSQKALEGHPKVGASWEGFALEMILRNSNAAVPYFWATASGAELDLLLLRDGKKWGFEFKFSETPTVTKSMRVAINDLSLEKLWIVCPGALRVPVADKIEICGIEKVHEVLVEHL